MREKGEEKDQCFCLFVCLFWYYRKSLLSSNEGIYEYFFFHLFFFLASRLCRFRAQKTILAVIIGCASNTVVSVCVSTTLREECV